MIVAVKFDGNEQPIKLFSKIKLQVGDKVVGNTKFGLQLGSVQQINVICNIKIKLNTIERIATETDYEKYLKNLYYEKKMLGEIRNLVEEQRINISVLEVHYSLDNKKLLVIFTSEDKLDFKYIVKLFAKKYHKKIDLHQIGVRERSRGAGGIGLCGREICCHRLKQSINAININMVKEQDISLNPARINGLCGRLLCCFEYENEFYEEQHKKLPKIKQAIEKGDIKGTVISVNVIKNKCLVKCEDGRYEEIIFDD